MMNPSRWNLLNQENNNVSPHFHHVAQIPPQQPQPLLPLLSENSEIPWIVNVTPKRKSSKASNLLRDVLTDQEMESFSSSQIMRQFKMTNGRMGPVMSMLVAEKRRTVYCGTLDKKIRAWSISSGEMEGEFEGHTGYASSLVLQPLSEDSELLFSGGSDGTIRSWNPDTYQMEKVFKGHKAHVNLIRVSDVFYPVILLFSASSDGTIKIWNATTTELLHTITMGESVHSLEIFSQPKSIHLLAASRTLKCYMLSDPKTLKQLSTCEGHTDAIWSLLFFFLPPNGHFAFTGSWDRTIRLWNLNSGQCVLKYEGHLHHVYCMTTNQNPGAIYGYVDRMINKQNLNLSANLLVPQVTPIGTPVPGSLEDLMAHNSNNQNVGEAVSKAMSEATDNVNNMTLVDDSIYPEFIPDTLFTGAADGVAIGWDIMSGKQIVKFEGHKGSIEQIRYDGNWLYTASSDKTIRIWHPKTGKCLSVYIGHHSFVEHLRIVPGGIFSGGNDGTVILWCGYRQQNRTMSRGGSFFDFIKGIREEQSEVLSPDRSPRRSSIDESISPLSESSRSRRDSTNVDFDGENDGKKLSPSTSVRGSLNVPLFSRLGATNRNSSSFTLSKEKSRGTINSEKISPGHKSKSENSSFLIGNSNGNHPHIRGERRGSLGPRISDTIAKLNDLKTEEKQPVAKTESLASSPTSSRKKFFESLGSGNLKSPSNGENIHQNPLFGRGNEVEKVSPGLTTRMASFRERTEREKETVDANPKKQQRGISAFFLKSPTSSKTTTEPLKVVNNPLLGQKSPLKSPKRAIEPVEIPLSNQIGRPITSSSSATIEENHSHGDGSGNRTPKSDTEARLNKLMERLENNIKGDQLLIQKLQQMVKENIQEEDEHLTSRPFHGSKSFDQGSNGRPRRISMPGTPAAPDTDSSFFKHLSKNKKSRSFPDLSMRMMIIEMELIEAAQKKDHKAMQYLLRHGSCDVNAKDEEGLTALHWSCKMNDERGAKLILRHGKGVKINMQDDLGCTPLHYAAEENNVSIVVNLLSLPSIDGKVLNTKKLRPADLTTSKPIQDLIKHATKTQTKGQNYGSIRVTSNPLMRQRRKVSSAAVSPAETRKKSIVNLFPMKEDPT